MVWYQIEKERAINFPVICVCGKCGSGRNKMRPLQKAIAGIGDNMGVMIKAMVRADHIETTWGIVRSEWGQGCGFKQNNCMHGTGNNNKIRMLQDPGTFFCFQSHFNVFITDWSDIGHYQPFFIKENFSPPTSKEVKRLGWNANFYCFSNCILPRTSSF